MTTSEIGGESERWSTHENQSGIEVVVVLLDVIHVIFGRLPLVEAETRIIILDGKEERSESILEAVVVRRASCGLERTTLNVAGRPFRPFP